MSYSSLLALHSVFDTQLYLYLILLHQSIAMIGVETPMTSPVITMISTQKIPTIISTQKIPTIISTRVTHMTRTPMIRAIHMTRTPMTRTPMISTRETRSGQEMSGLLLQARSGKETLGAATIGLLRRALNGREIRGMSSLHREIGREMNGTPPSHRKFFLH